MLLNDLIKLAFEDSGSGGGPTVGRTLGGLDGYILDRPRELVEDMVSKTKPARLLAFAHHAEKAVHPSLNRVASFIRKTIGRSESLVPLDTKAELRTVGEVAKVSQGSRDTIGDAYDALSKKASREVIMGIAEGATQGAVNRYIENVEDNKKWGGFRKYIKPTKPLSGVGGAAWQGALAHPTVRALTHKDQNPQHLQPLTQHLQPEYSTE